MKFKGGAPAITLSVSNDSAWVIYENGYIEFARFDDDGSSAERLSHWVQWGEETYPTTEEDLVNVMTRVLDAIANHKV